MAYVKDIKPNTKDSHQTSPAYMITFVRWGVKDTNTVDDIAAGLSVKEPLIVINDCTQLNVNVSKKSHIQGASMVLMAGEVNYAAAISVGDFVFINMLDNDEKLFGKGGSHKNYAKNSLFDRAVSKLPINGAHDGFKGMFKVTSVRRFLGTNKGTGQKQVYFQITAQAFSELNQVIYFNSYAFDSQQDGTRVLTALNGNVAKDFVDQQSKAEITLGEIYRLLVAYTLGAGFPKNFAPDGKQVTVNYNKNFLVPPLTARLMGIVGANYAADLFTHYVGIQKFSSSRNATEETGLNPKCTRGGSFLDCGTSPRGSTLIIGEYWNQVTAWSLINQYINPSVNEIFTSFRLIPEGKVVPCVTFRQKPFTSDKFAKDNSGIEATTFSSLPRWRIDPALIYSYSLGKDDTARINFVQVLGKSRTQSMEDILAFQNSLKNWEDDMEDIRRNGLRPYITVSDFDFPTTDEKGSSSPIWTKLNYDWLNNGHLKENGSITCVGLEEPIAVGDNLELDGNIYHIEDIAHSMSIAPDGHKSFDTTLKVSYGVSKTSNPVKNVYPEDLPPDMNSKRADDYNRDGMMPGVSDDQEGSSQATGGTLKDGKVPSFTDVSSKSREKLNNTVNKKK
jgi:hypothetical protein